jgi:pantetheine-phosphate adenylyltransferase
MKIALFAGTFDPPTLGHQEIIERVCKLCDKLYVAVAISASKRNEPINLIERVSLLQTLTKSLKNVEIVSFSGLVVDYAKELKADVLVRGLRNGGDLDYELQMASANRLMTGIETLCLLSSPQYSQINSTLIREIAAGGRSLAGFVPHIIQKRIEELL